jgi:site-specific DNA-methyltransferase (adenine-specific)
MEINKIYTGNNIDVLRTFPSNSIDSVVTDPPYGISFMNKHWDYDVPSVETWAEVLRVLKPGGHILVACGTRTQHRMTTNIEDAGFEIRDIVAWVYGSGFPKSHDVSKAIDKTLGAEREVIGKHQQPAKSIYTQSEVEMSKDVDITTPSTDEAKQWQGWGTALKPALEPIVMARKPLDGTVANNVLKHGVGGINIDGCRVETDEEWQGRDLPNAKDGVTWGGSLNSSSSSSHPNGRFPANVIHDGSEEVVKLFPNEDDTSASRFFYTAKASQSERNEGLWGFEETPITDGRDKPIDNAYNRGMTEKRNIHPTVKPLELMRYLCRMITPKGGIVLDPFIGSGTTAIAAKQEKMNYIGMELEPKYVEIANARIKSAVVQYDIFDMMEATL